MIETLNFAFPTVLTSGTILAVAGTLIGQMTSEATIAGIGQSLGRGTVISMFLVLFVLPQILLIGSRIVDKTSFAVPNPIRRREASGRVFVDGVVSGEIHGTVSGIMRANIDGDVRLNIISGSIAQAYGYGAPESVPQLESGEHTADEAAAGENGAAVQTAEKEAGSDENK